MIYAWSSFDFGQRKSNSKYTLEIAKISQSGEISSNPVTLKGYFNRQKRADPLFWSVNLRLSLHEAKWKPNLFERQAVWPDLAKF